MTHAKAAFTPARLFVVLGLMSALGPVTVDMYLPAFGAIAADLRTDIAMIQASLVAYFAALALGQVFYGPLSDRVGRKPPILGGIAVFILASIGCALAESGAMLIAFRFVQGLGICAILAIMRAIIRDLHDGPEAAQLMSRVMLIVSVSPMLAPLGGSALIAVASWHAIFWTLAALGAGLFVLVWRALPETRPDDAHAPDGPSSLAVFARLLGDASYRRPLILLCAAQAGASTYLAGSSFIYVEAYGFAPASYSVAFAANAIGMIGLAQFNRRLIMRFGIPALLMAGVAGLLGASGLFALLAAAGGAGAGVMMACFFAYFTAFGVIMGPASVMAMQAHGAVAGRAAALMGSCQFTAGALGSLPASLFFDGTIWPTVLTMVTASALAALAAARLVLAYGGHARPATAA